MKKIFTLSMVLMLAGFYAAAQINISAQEKFNPQKPVAKYLPTEKPLPLPQKQIAGQDWWEPDTVCGFGVIEGAVVGGKRFISDYNSYGLPEMRLQQNLEAGTSWKDQYQWTYTYDPNNNLLAELYRTNDYHVQGASWENTVLLTYTYDSNNNRLTELNQSYWNDSWQNTVLFTYTYDSNNNRRTDLYQNYRNDSWENSMLFTYTYDSNNNRRTDLYQSYRNDSWENSTLFTYTYDSNNNRLTYLEQDWTGTEWKNYRLSTYTYDSNNNMLTELRQSWVGAEWVNSTQSTYTYDSNSNMLTGLSRSWAGAEWVNSTQSTYTYDSNNNRITGLHQRWENDSWTDYPQALWTYDENNNCTLAENSSDLYYNNMQSYFEPVNLILITEVTASYIKVNNPNAIEEPVNILTNTISVYPNPTTGELKIESGELRINNIEIFDMLGRKLSTFNFQLSTIDVSHLPTGVYFLRIQTETGTVTRRIIKK